jgi:cytochrome c551/c552
MKSSALLLIALMSALTFAGCSKPAGDQKSSAGATGATAASGSKYDAGPRAAESPVDHEQAERGAQLFKDKGCSACHTFGQKLSGPDLQGVASRRTAEWMENQILHPEVMTKEDPISRQLMAVHALQMPNQGLTPDEARAVIEFFKSKELPDVAESK